MVEEERGKGGGGFLRILADSGLSNWSFLLLIGEQEQIFTSRSQAAAMSPLDQRLLFAIVEHLHSLKSEEGSDADNLDVACDTLR